MEETLIVLKPDTVQRGLVGEIITRFEKVGLKIVGMKMVYPDKAHYHKHYEEIGKMITRRGQDKFRLDFGRDAVWPSSGNCARRYRSYKFGT